MDVLDGDEVRVVHLAEIEDLGDVRVLQLHRDLRLVDEHRDELFVLGDVGRMRLMATMRSKPSTPKAFALNTSAMPPTLMRSSR